ncbi:glycylpeptide N-tetradecanoyltransferase, partial [Physocladia obscura]
AQRIVEINFLCIHKKLRSKRLAPLLIKEITRLVNLEGIFQAAYTAGRVIPTPVSQSRYWHRSLNFKKLVDVGFSYVPKDSTMVQMLRKLKLPTEPQIPGTRPMEARDIPTVHMLLSNFLAAHTDLFPIFSVEEIEHWFIPIEDVVYSYVVEDLLTGRVTDFYSFYNLPSSILKNEKYNHLRAAYLFYYCPLGNGNDHLRTTALINDALIQAYVNEFDVFNCLDLMGNHRFLEKLQFGKGDGTLNYYLYNYRCRIVENQRMGVVKLIMKNEEEALRPPVRETQRTTKPANRAPAPKPTAAVLAQYHQLLRVNANTNANTNSKPHQNDSINTHSQPRMERRQSQPLINVQSQLNVQSYSRIPSRPLAHANLIPSNPNSKSNDFKTIECAPPAGYRDTDALHREVAEKQRLLSQAAAAQPNPLLQLHKLTRSSSAPALRQQLPVTNLVTVDVQKPFDVGAIRRQILVKRKAFADKETQQNKQQHPELLQQQVKASKSRADIKEIMKEQVKQRHKEALLHQMMEEKQKSQIKKGLNNLNDFRRKQLLLNHNQNMTRNSTKQIEPIQHQDENLDGRGFDDQFEQTSNNFNGDKANPQQFIDIQSPIKQLMDQHLCELESLEIILKKNYTRAKSADEPQGLAGNTSQIFQLQQQISESEETGEPSTSDMLVIQSIMRKALEIQARLNRHPPSNQSNIEPLPQNFNQNFGTVADSSRDSSRSSSPLLSPSILSSRRESIDSVGMGMIAGFVVSEPRLRSLSRGRRREYGLKETEAAVKLQRWIRSLHAAEQKSRSVSNIWLKNRRNNADESEDMKWKNLDEDENFANQSNLSVGINDDPYKVFRVLDRVNPGFGVESSTAKTSGPQKQESKNPTESLTKVIESADSFHDVSEFRAAEENSKQLSPLEESISKQDVESITYSESFEPKDLFADHFTPERQSHSSVNIPRSSARHTEAQKTNEMTDKVPIKIDHISPTSFVHDSLSSKIQKHKEYLASIAYSDEISSSDVSNTDTETQEHYRRNREHSHPKWIRDDLYGLSPRSLTRKLENEMNHMEVIDMATAQLSEVRYTQLISGNQQEQSSLTDIIRQMRTSKHYEDLENARRERELTELRLQAVRSQADTGPILAVAAGPDNSSHTNEARNFDYVSDFTSSISALNAKSGVSSFDVKDSSLSEYVSAPAAEETTSIQSVDESIDLDILMNRENLRVPQTEEDFERTFEEQIRSLQEYVKLKIKNEKLRTLAKYATSMAEIEQSRKKFRTAASLSTSDLLSKKSTSNDQTSSKSRNNLFVNSRSTFSIPTHILEDSSTNLLEKSENDSSSIKEFVSDDKSTGVSYSSISENIEIIGRQETNIDSSSVSDYSSKSSQNFDSTLSKLPKSTGSATPTPGNIIKPVSSISKVGTLVSNLSDLETKKERLEKSKVVGEAILEEAKKKAKLQNDILLLQLQCNEIINQCMKIMGQSDGEEVQVSREEISSKKSDKYLQHSIVVLKTDEKNDLEKLNPESISDVQSEILLRQMSVKSIAESIRFEIDSVKQTVSQHNEFDGIPEIIDAVERDIKSFVDEISSYGDSSKFGTDIISSVSSFNQTTEIPVKYSESAIYDEDFENAEEPALGLKKPVSEMTYENFSVYPDEVSVEDLKRMEELQSLLLAKEARLKILDEQKKRKSKDTKTARIRREEEELLRKIQELDRVINQAEIEVLEPVDILPRVEIPKSLEIVDSSLRNTSYVDHQSANSTQMIPQIGKETVTSNVDIVPSPEITPKFSLESTPEKDILGDTKEFNEVFHEEQESVIAEELRNNLSEELSASENDDNCERILANMEIHDEKLKTLPLVDDISSYGASLSSVESDSRAISDHIDKNLDEALAQYETNFITAATNKLKSLVETDELEFKYGDDFTSDSKNQMVTQEEITYEDEFTSYSNMQGGILLHPGLSSTDQLKSVPIGGVDRIEIENAPVSAEITFARIAKEEPEEVVRDTSTPEIILEEIAEDIVVVDSSPNSDDEFSKLYTTKKSLHQEILEVSGTTGEDSTPENSVNFSHAEEAFSVLAELQNPVNEIPEANLTMKVNPESSMVSNLSEKLSSESNVESTIEEFALTTAKTDSSPQEEFFEIDVKSSTIETNAAFDEASLRVESEKAVDIYKGIAVSNVNDITEHIFQDLLADSVQAISNQKRPEIVTKNLRSSFPDLDPDVSSSISKFDPVEMPKRWDIVELDPEASKKPLLITELAESISNAIFEEMLKAEVEASDNLSKQDSVIVAEGERQNEPDLPKIEPIQSKLGALLSKTKGVSKRSSLEELVFAPNNRLNPGSSSSNSQNENTGSAATTNVSVLQQLSSPVDRMIYSLTNFLAEGEGVTLTSSKFADEFVKGFLALIPPPSNATGYDAVPDYRSIMSGFMEYKMLDPILKNRYILLTSAIEEAIQEIFSLHMSYGKAKSATRRRKTMVSLLPPRHITAEELQQKVLAIVHSWFSYPEEYGENLDAMLIAEVLQDEDEWKDLDEDYEAVQEICVDGILTDVLEDSVNIFS